MADSVNGEPVGLKTVGRYTDAIRAHLARGRLEAEGIEAFVAHEHHVWADWMVSNALGGVKVQVKPDMAARAKLILEDMEEGAYALEEEAEPCPRCGSTDTVEAKAEWKWAFVAFMFLHIPLPFRRAMRRCGRCGHDWDESESPGAR